MVLNQEEIFNKVFENPVRLYFYRKHKAKYDKRIDSVNSDVADRNYKADEERFKSWIGDINREVFLLNINYCYTMFNENYSLFELSKEEQIKDIVSELQVRYWWFVYNDNFHRLKVDHWNLAYHVTGLVRNPKKHNR